MNRARAAIAAGHPETVRAAEDALRRGGNAFDAAVAAGFAATVAEPGLTSLGGGGFLVARTAEGEEILFDFFVDTPGLGRSGDLEPHLTTVTVRFKGADQVFHAGWGSVAVPGCLAGLTHVHRRLGRLDLSVLVAPARRLATEGVMVNPQQAEIVALLETIFTLTDEGRRLFQVDGHYLREGDRFRNLPLADLLVDVGAGRVTSFADPTLGGALASAMDADAGLVTTHDLEAYRVIERAPLELRYRGSRVVTNPPPSFGASLVARALEALSADGTQPVSLDRLVAVLVAMADEHALRPRSTQGTTHVSVSDGEGNVAAMTTSNGSCSGVFVPGTGVQLNNIMGEEDLHPDGLHAWPPGMRVGSMMAPTLLELGDGTIVALGTGGSERIKSAITQVAVNLVDHGLDLEAAIRAPRLHWDGHILQVEPGIDPAAIAELAIARPTNVWLEPNLYFGGVHAASTAGEAAGDPRRGGSTALLPME